jgi:hypothetical protein
LVVALLESYGNPDGQLRTVTSPAPNRVYRVYERDQPTPQFEDSKKKLSTILTGDILVKLYLPMTSSEPTFGPLTTKRPSAGGTEFDDLDDLFSYDVGDENDPFSDNYKPPNKNDATKESTSKSSKGDAGLGIDEEVEVSKKIRAPRVKLDEHRYSLEA